MGYRAELKQARTRFPNLLKGFESDFNVDAAIEKIQTDFYAHPPSPQLTVDEYKLALNVSDVQTLLDRLLTLRRELWDLDALRVRTALGYLNAIKQVEVDNSVTIAQSPSHNLSEVKAACERRLQATIDAVAQMEARHGEAGSSLNFGDRIAKLMALLSYDIGSCYVRSLAVFQGASLVYGINLSRPRPGADRTYADFEGAAYLDDWVAWHRQLSTRMESMQAYESTFEVVLPLGTPALYSSNSPGQDPQEKPVTLIQDLTQKIRKEGVDFMLTPGPRGSETHFLPRKCLRPMLLEVGVMINVPAAVMPQGWRYQVEITVPQAETPIRINVEAGNNITWGQSNAVVGKPAIGAWKIVLVSACKGDVTDLNQTDRVAWPIWDVKLGLRLSGVPYEPTAA